MARTPGTPSVHMDQITEEIAHFIGLFQTTIEQGRLRQDYNEFKDAQAADPLPPAQDGATISFSAPYTFDHPEPGLRYIPFSAEIVHADVYTHVSHTPPSVPVSSGVDDGTQPLRLGSVGSSTHSVVEYVIPPPGSIAVFIAQDGWLADNDYVSVGGNGMFLAPITAAAQAAALSELFDDASAVMPLAPPGPPGDGDQIAAFVEQAVPFLHNAAGQLATGEDMTGPQTTASHFVAESGTALDGRYVNGSVRDELPGLSDHLPDNSLLAARELEARESDPDVDMAPNQGVNGPSSSASGAVAGGGELPDPSVRLDAGGNAVVNTASVANTALGGTVFAVGGDHVELNAVMQVNAWSDNDSIGHYLTDRMSAPFDSTTAFNIAQFERISPGTGADAPDPATQGGFPRGWAVTEIEGDLIFMNWLQQFNFVSDHDVHVMSSSGVATKTMTGGNLVANDISVTDLGNNYDLVMAGGALHDANIISQTNVLLDDDLVGALDGFETSGEAKVSTGDNLLWNEASITNVGDAGRFDVLPEDYRTALDNYASGSKDLPDGVLRDDAFADTSMLRVLYVSGNICDLQYISQTNVLGDGDEVALAMQTAAKGADADWDITTGSNVLLNSASILDLDTTGKTYVGGDQYSDELLVQSDIIRTDQSVEARDADALVNEAVVFLGDDMLGQDNLDSHTRTDDDGSSGQPAYHDVMQTMIS